VKGMVKISEVFKNRKWQIAVANVLVIAFIVTLILTANAATSNEPIDDSVRDGNINFSSVYVSVGGFIEEDIPNIITTYEQFRRMIRLNDIWNISAIHSEDLDVIWQPDQINNYLQRYNRNFFRNNSLIVFTIVSSSGSARYQVNSIVRQGSELEIKGTRFMPANPNLIMDNIGYWIILSEVKQSDVVGVTRIINGVWDLQFINEEDN